MRPRWIQQFLFIGIVASLYAVPAIARQSADQEQDAAHAEVERLLQAVASGEEFDADSTDVVPILIRIAEGGELREADLAIRALGRMKSEAVPAIPVLCETLDDRRHSLRSVAADALVAIGEDSVEPLRNLIDSASGRTRAAAMAALSRLQRFDARDLDRLARDPDPRARAVVANSLTDLGRPGVPQLSSYLTDPELAVAVAAAHGLKSNRDDPSIAIPKLTEALSRPHLGWAAADALAAYGVEARRAIPALIRDFPAANAFRFDWRYSAQQALWHIGPPDERDLSALLECLAHQNVDVQTLAATRIALLGAIGRSAAPLLEAAMETNVGRLRELRRTSEATLEWRENLRRVFVAAENQAAALWYVTRDADRFLSSIETIVLAADRRAVFSPPKAWDGFSADDCLLMESMLRSSNINVQYTALYGISAIGATAEPLTGVILELADAEDAELAQQAIQALAAIGPSVAEEAAPVLISRFRDETIPLRQFAIVAGDIQIRSLESQTILEHGLEDSNQFTAMKCAQALCITSDEPDRIAARIIEMAHEGRFEHDDALEVLQPLVPAEASVLPYLIDQMSNDKEWTRHDAISAVGAYGEAASVVIPRLEMQLDDESARIRLAAAKSIYQISGDASSLEQELESVFVDPEGNDRLHAIATITELGRLGAPFLQFVERALREAEPLSEVAWLGFDAKLARLIDALKAIGTAEADVVLEEAAKSTDWVLRSQATAALQELRDSDTPGDN